MNSTMHLYPVDGAAPPMEHRPLRGAAPVLRRRGVRDHSDGGGRRDGYERLARLNATYDPDNVLRVEPEHPAECDHGWSRPPCGSEVSLKIAVVGLGAMGSVYSGLLASAGNEVWAVDVWAEHVEAIRSAGLRLEGASGDRVVRINATTDATEV